ncbi:hypothetical protein MHU86_7514 [Fragilaria crotonensis]|nr:hypothetical protein MHU86_7514 [Fragilaria crotonensis]
MSRFSASPIMAAFARANVVGPPNEEEDDDIIGMVVQEMAEELRARAEDADTQDVEQEENLGVLEDRLPHQKRSLQQVVTISSRRETVRWMMTEFDANGKKELISKAVAKFPEYFRGSYKANHQRASNWWKARHTKYSNYNMLPPASVQRNQISKVTRVNLKASAGRGRKASAWVVHVYAELMDEFLCLRKTGLKFSTALLGTLARDIIKNSDGLFNSHYRDPHDNKLIQDKITTRWVQCFMSNHNVVVRSQTGKLMCSPEKELHIQKTIAFHMGELHRGFSSGELDENLIENMDETHFVINVDNGRTLGVRGDNDVKYADVVSGGEGMTMMVRLTGGPTSYIQPPMMIFTNQSRSYPIAAVPDNIPGVCYRSGPKGWNDKTLFPQWFTEPRAYQGDQHGRQKVMYLDNCGGHNHSDALTAALEATHTHIKYFPPCATDKVQPADSFVISKIKDAWKKRWDIKKMEMIRENMWSNGVRRDGAWSGKLQNPGKRFFLQLAADSVRDVNMQRDVNGLTYARKAMIRCGLALDVTGLWHIQQLSPQLQAIIATHRNHFDGEAVPPPG